MTWKKIWFTKKTCKKFGKKNGKYFENDSLHFHFLQLSPCSFSANIREILTKVHQTSAYNCKMCLENVSIREIARRFYVFLKFRGLSSAERKNASKYCRSRQELSNRIPISTSIYLQNRRRYSRERASQSSRLHLSKFTCKACKKNEFTCIRQANAQDGTYQYTPFPLDFSFPYEPCMWGPC